MNQTIKKYFFFFFFFSVCLVSAQTDTSKTFGTIKIARQKDSTYIKAYAEFKTFNEEYSYSDNSYKSMVGSVGQYVPIIASPRVIIEATHPDNGLIVFDYTGFFQMNRYTKGIKMRKGEGDTLNFYVTVDMNGNMKFKDALPVERLGDTTVVYTSFLKLKYKIDVSHVKTGLAVEELSKKKWVPAKIKRLKKHPSKHRIKYTTSNGYSDGIITVIYSTTPFKD